MPLRIDAPAIGGETRKVETSDWLQFGVAFRYDASGNVLEETTNFADVGISRTQNTYDQYGNALTSTTIEQSAISLEYEYDSRGNWIRTAVRHSLGIDEYRREITYRE